MIANPESWLMMVSNLASSDEKMLEIYSSFDDEYKLRNFGVVDNVLETINLNAFPELEVLIAFLAAVYAAKPQLKQYDPFYERLWSHILVAFPYEDVNHLLKGFTN